MNASRGLRTIRTGTLFLVLLLCANAAAQTVGPAFRVFPSTVTQTEPVLAMHPLDPLTLVASARTINTQNGFQSEGVYLSQDGGRTWRGTDTCSGELLANHGGDPGVVVHQSGRFVLTHIGRLFPGVYSHTSSDLGATWSNAVTISSQQPEDKGSVAMDDVPSSTYFGRLYTAWVQFVLPYPLSFSSSTNAGSTWSTPTSVNPAPPARCSGGTIAVGADGTVYTTWAGVTAASPFTEDFAGFAVSTNGGVTWSVRQNIFDMNGINGSLAAKSNIRVNGLPQIAVDRSAGVRRGWLYIATGERGLDPAGTDPDIVLHRSTDGGQTWSAGIRVNQDALNNGKIQYMPAMDVDDGGGVNILFYDDRATTADSAGVVLARSTDGGTSWREFTVSDHRFKPVPIVGGGSGYQGDHIALEALGTRLAALWMDNSSGIYQVWCSFISLGPDAVAEQTGLPPAKPVLDQNFPNPFNGSTTVSFNVPASLAGRGTDRPRVSLRIFDILGRQVGVLADETLAPGQYTRRWDAGVLPSGVYFSRLSVGAMTTTRTMMLTR